MDTQTLHQMADSLGLNYTFRTRKPQLIRTIQNHLDQRDCFATDVRFTCTNECKWRAECQKPIAAWLR